jgi:hypothetical protein
MCWFEHTTPFFRLIARLRDLPSEEIVGRSIITHVCMGTPSAVHVRKGAFPAEFGAFGRRGSWVSARNESAPITIASGLPNEAGFEVIPLVFMAFAS